MRIKKKPSILIVLAWSIMGVGAWLMFSYGGGVAKRVLQSELDELLKLTLPFIGIAGLIVAVQRHSVVEGQLSLARESQKTTQLTQIATMISSENAGERTSGLLLADVYVKENPSKAAPIVSLTLTFFERNFPSANLLNEGIHPLYLKYFRPMYEGFDQELLEGHLKRNENLFISPIIKVAFERLRPSDVEYRTFCEIVKAEKSQYKLSNTAIKISKQFTDPISMEKENELLESVNGSYLEGFALTVRSNTSFFSSVFNDCYFFFKDEVEGPTAKSCIFDNCDIYLDRVQSFETCIFFRCRFHKNESVDVVELVSLSSTFVSCSFYQSKQVNQFILHGQSTLISTMIFANDLVLQGELWEHHLVLKHQRLTDPMVTIFTGNPTIWNKTSEHESVKIVEYVVS
ncbi:MAG: hypothetical protein MK172_08740 [Verrucomicrobiales bacterium]|nr:hypothetical protein [Verrucomicrobiales bacterium]